MNTCVWRVWDNICSLPLTRLVLFMSYWWFIPTEREKQRKKKNKKDGGNKKLSLYTLKKVNNGELSIKVVSLTDTDKFILCSTAVYMKIHVKIIFPRKRIKAEALSKKKENTKRKVASDTLRRAIKSCKTWVFAFMTAKSVSMIVNTTIMALLICMVNISIICI